MTWTQEEDDPQCIDYLEIETETEKAYLFVTQQGKFWAPKSISEIEPGMVVVLPHWFEINYLKE